jgi:myo-inositol 2-dehydrogenase / D-chiro-inositol 1-dehydrogenase
VAPQLESSGSLSRRDFIRTSAVATAGLMASGNFAYAAGSDTLRVGLVGCGGRGTGAARDCVTSAPGVQLYAIADLFQDRMDSSREQLRQHIPDHLDLTDERCFTGFDGYRHVIDSGVDLVLLATPPGFRPVHLRAAVEAGRHVFMEKPVAVDSAGCRSIIESGEMARSRNLSIVAGTQYRRQPSFVEGIRRIHDGMIGDIVAAQEYYLTGPIWLRDRKPGMSDMEWQCRNWYYFTWLSGDHIVEQFVHNLDTINWVMQANPVSALGMGGRLVRVDPSYGHIYDHFSIEYVYPGDVRVEAKCRQMEGTTRRVTNRIVGTKGIAHLHTDNSQIVSHDGRVLYSHPERGNNPYVQEHTDLVAAIRSNTPINEAQEVTDSTMVGILGRESAYTGQELTWDEVVAADLDLVPSSLTFGPLPFPPVPLPGVTRLARPAFAHAHG